MGAEPAPCNIQISATNNGVIMKLQCIVYLKWYKITEIMSNEV